MNATSNPQSTADQARKNNGEMTSPDGSVPEAVRSMNEKTVAQTREVYDRSKDAFNAQVSTLERTFDAAGQGVVALNRKFVDIVQRNVNAAFDLAKSMAGAKNLAEMLQLQGDYWQKLCGNVTSQAEELRALSSKVTAAAGEQVKGRWRIAQGEMSAKASELERSPLSDRNEHRTKSEEAWEAPS